MSRPLIPFGYFGGKSKHLKHLLPQLNAPHKLYCELFAGSAAVLLNKPRVKYEILNDLSGDIANFWKVLRERPDELCDAVDLTPAGEVAFKECINAPPTDCPVEKARRFFVQTSQAFGGKPACHSHSNRLAVTYQCKRKDLRQVATVLANVIVENSCACRVITRTMSCKPDINFDNTLFYADPPYLADTRVAGNDVYLVDYFGDDSVEFHREFLDTVLANSSNAKFAISGYAHPLYDDALADWHRVEWNHIDGNSKDERVEVLWRNYDILPSGTQSLF